MSDSRGLRLVPYSPSDYSLGEILARNDGFTTQNSAQISAALSLYFQWEESRYAAILFDQAQFVPCILDYDRDERQPSELRIQFSSVIEAPRYEAFQKVSIRFEVFQVCYEFTAEVLAVSTQPQEDGWGLIISVPIALTVFKARRMPRLELTKEAVVELKGSTWTADGESSITIEVTEIGLKGISARASLESLKSSKGNLTILGNSFQAELIRTCAQRAIFVLNPKDGAEYGIYFDVYRKFAYPHLRPRTDFTPQQGIELYRNTNYFQKFLTEKDAASAYAEIQKTWELVASGTHETTADYFVVDDKNSPVGASSATLAFFKGEEPMWVFHQLCSIAKPDYLDHTGDLYTWRAEYLAGRPEMLSAGVWFDSKSRWIERIYTKFIMQRNGKSQIFPVKLNKIRKLTSINQDSKFTISKTINLGRAQRVIVQSDLGYAGVGPAYLNASRTLDAVICINVEHKKLHLIDLIPEELSSRATESIEVTSLVNTVLDFESEEIEGTDRFCLIMKDDLIDFMSSVHHTVAVSKKKMNA